MQEILNLESKDELTSQNILVVMKKEQIIVQIMENGQYEMAQVLFKDGHPEYLINSIQYSKTKTSGAVLKINLD